MREAKQPTARWYAVQAAYIGHDIPKCKFVRSEHNVNNNSKFKVYRADESFSYDLKSCIIMVFMNQM